MARYSKGLEAFAILRRKKQSEKALRLAKGKPKWKDEKYMKREELEAYIDRYLEDDVDVIPSEAQVKVAKSMYDTKMKYEEVSADVNAELDMEAFMIHAKESVESESVTVKKDLH